MLVPREPFSLDAKFLDGYRGRDPAWSGLGELVYYRTYSNPLPAGGTEDFWQTCARVIEGMYQIQKGHCKRLGLPWSDEKAQASAQEAYTRMFAFKWLPPGRGLSKMGTDYLFKYGGAALFNCGAYSTINIGNRNVPNAFSRPFTWTLIMSMLGVGVGIDTRGAGTVSIINPTRTDEPYIIPDSREGWADYLQRILESYVDYSVALPNNVDYSLIRPLGAPIKGFGGTASGPEALQKISSRIHTLMRMYMGKLVDSRFIVDLTNSIGECVVAGGTRRSSQITFSTIDDDKFMRLKDWNNPESRQWPRWASNNSVFVDVDSDFSQAAALTANNGEPGYLFLENARKYGRMADAPDYKDAKIVHTNPCQPAHATVLTPTGMSTMGALKVGDTIWSGSNWTRVVNKISTGVKQVYEYHTRAGIFIGTPNHRVVSSGEKIEVGIAHTIDTAQGPGSSGELDPQDILDGLVIGDGCRRSDKTRDLPNKRVLLCIGANDQDYFQSEVAHLIHEDYSHKSMHVVTTTVQYEEVPVLQERVVPSRFYFGDTVKMRGFLRGLYSANGSLCNARVTLKSVNIYLIYEIQEMLSVLGIQSYYTVNKPAKVRFRNGEYLCAESYDLNITTARTKFAELIGFIQRYKTEKLNALCETVTPPRRTKVSFEITDRVDLGELKVFDITVDAAEHTYWSGGLLVSNCGEIGLFSGELCNLVETFPHNCDSYEDYERTLKFAYLYSKTVTLVPTHDEETNAVMLRNRRIGCSQSGIQDSIAKIGLREHLKWSDQGYKYIQKLDGIYSDWLCIPRSIKTTTLKPSGSVSKVASCREGIHHEKSEYILQAIRIHNTSPLIKPLRDANYRVEEAVNEPNTVVVYFPIHSPKQRPAETITMWEQLELGALMQYYWCDNLCSQTIDFDKVKEGPYIQQALEMYAHRIKGTSFLPRDDHGYVQAPKTPITKEEYATYVATLKPYSLRGLQGHDTDERYCSNGICEINVEPSEGTEK